MAVTLLDLPSEAILEIVCFMSMHDILYCQQTCRYLNNLIKNSALARYTIELGIAGMVDNPDCKLTLARRRELLRQKEDGWANVRTVRAARIHVDHNPSGIYDFSGGVYLLGEAPSNLGFLERVTCALNYLVLPSSESAELQAQTWNTINLEERVIDLGLCLQEHGLIAIATWRPSENDLLAINFLISLHLLDFFNGSPHPAAAQPVILVMEKEYRNSPASVNIEIVGDILALLITFPHENHVNAQDSFFLYQWKTGKLLGNYTYPPGTYSTLVFLTENLIVLPALRTHTLEIHRVSDSETPFEPVGVLGLPQLRPEHYKVFGISCRAEPNPMGKWSARTGRRTGLHPGGYKQRPFFPDPDRAIIIFHICLGAMPTGIPDFFYSLVVHRKSVLDATVEKFSTPCPDGPIKWEDWGPRVSRWFDINDVPSPWITVTAGQRYATISNEARFDAARIQVLDFNPYHVARRSSRQTQQWFKGADNSQHDTVLPGEGVFERDVVSRLPFVKDMSAEAYNYDAILMDDERIIGMELDDMEEHVKWVDILNIT